MSAEIQIRSGEHVLSRIIEGKCIEELGAILEKEKHTYLVYDKKAGLHARKLKGFVNASLALDTGEDTKTLATVEKICIWLLNSGADRNALLVAVGGGITTDMCGMAASIYKRGIRFAYVPTTLLAQVDAAIGGKTGVNLLSYKNMLGTIRQSEFTWMSPDVLTTLPEGEFFDGAAELLKTFIIDNSSHSYSAAVRMLRTIRADGWTAEDYFPQISRLVHEAAKVKAAIVERDQFENGERRLLNLGHTFAHAIEHHSRLDGSRITHGEAVAMGIILAARVAVRLDDTKHKGRKNICDTLIQDFTDCGLPVKCPYALEDLSEAMRKDKKAEDGKIHFILPFAIGDVRIVDLTVEEMMENI